MLLSTVSSMVRRCSSICSRASVLVSTCVLLIGDEPGQKYAEDRACTRFAFNFYIAGVRVYEFEPTLPHQKIVIVDSVWSHIGSTNFDARSLALNEEVGVGILDEKVAKELKDAFNADLKRSSELQLERWRHRPLMERGGSWLAYQLHSQL